MAEGAVVPLQEAPSAERGVAPRDTPMMRQYLEVKARSPDAILFFRLGDFYEMFFEDAVRAAELLEITLTSRAKGARTRAHVRRSLPRRPPPRGEAAGAGLKVAICDQVEQPGTHPAWSAAR